MEIFKIRTFGRFRTPGSWNPRYKSQTTSPQRVLHVFMNPRDFCTHSAGRGNECTWSNFRSYKIVKSKILISRKIFKSGLLDDFGLPETRIANYQPFIEKNKFEVRCFSRDQKILKSRIFKIFTILISRKFFKSGLLDDFGLPETRIANYQPFLEKHKFEVRCFSRDQKFLKSRIFIIIKNFDITEIFQTRIVGRFRTPGS